MHRREMDIRTQVAAARDSALIIAGAFSTLVITGDDRQTWLNGLVTCDLAKKAAGEATYGLVVARSGRVLADVIVFIEEARLILALPSAATETLRAHFEHYLVMEDAQVAPGSEAFETWMVHGPRSSELLARARGAGGIGAAIDRTGLGGALRVADRDHAEDVRRQLGLAAAEVGGAVGDEGGWRALRLERNVAEFGEDFDDKTYPQEAGLEKAAVSFDKGCYLGQEVVCMLEMRGHVKRKLAPLVLDAAGVPLRGAGVTDLAGTLVGEVTSAALSPTLGRVIALAMLKRGQAQPASVVLVDGGRAEVVDRPT
jgi:folate-binding protein YgfZ